MFRVLSLKFILAISILLGLSLVLYANSALAASAPNINLSTIDGVEQLQIGESWSRIHHDGKLTTTESLNKVIQATARVDTKSQKGTAFYLGKFGDSHLMLTNYHVMSQQLECKTGGQVYFQHQNEKYRCGKIIAAIPEIEATFFTIIVSNKYEYKFEGIALKFDFVNEYKPGHRIVTAGHGVYKNNSNKLTYENSSTCVVATTNFQSTLLNVKNKEGTKTYSAYSFVHACETSHGDSGAALVSESTGKVIGLNWATSTAKPLELLKSPVVFDWIENNDSRMWDSLSYGVPAPLIMSYVIAKKNPLLNLLVQSYFIQ